MNNKTRQRCCLNYILYSSLATVVFFWWAGEGVLLMGLLLTFYPASNLLVAENQIIKKKTLLEIFLQSKYI